jgi:hypothetical protein
LSVAVTFSSLLTSIVDRAAEILNMADRYRTARKSALVKNFSPANRTGSPYAPDRHTARPIGSVVKWRTN